MTGLPTPDLRRLQSEWDNEAAHLRARGLRAVIAAMPRSERIGALAFALAAPLLFAALWIIVP